MALMETLVDDFGLGANASTWTKDGTVLDQYGAVYISHTALAQYDSLLSNNTYDLTGSAAYVQVKDFGNQALASHEVTLQLSTDGSNVVRLTASNGNLLALKTVAGAQTVISSTALNQNLHQWFRIRESGGTVFFDTAPDGVSWTNRFSVANPFAVTALTASLVCGCWDNELSPSYAVFDNVNTLDPSPYSYQPTRIPNRRVGPQALRRLLRTRPRNIPFDVPVVSTGSASGAYTFAGAAAGTRTPKGTSSGGYTWAGTASGTRAPKGAAGGSATWAGAATGKLTAQGTASGSYTFSGSATGDAPPNAGAVSGAYGWAGSSTGARGSVASSAGGYGWSGTTGGTRASIGTASGGETFAGAATGQAQPVATASGTYGFSGSSSGKTIPIATSTGGYGWGGVTVGQTPQVGVNAGSGGGTYNFTGATSGARHPLALTTSLYGWGSTASGSRISEGTTQDSPYTFTGGAEGETPFLPPTTGATAGGYGWAGIAFGGVKVGHVGGSYGWAGRVFALLTNPSRERMLTVSAEDRALIVSAEDRVLTVAAELRTLTIPAESRALSVETEDRTIRIESEERGLTVGIS